MLLLTIGDTFAKTAVIADDTGAPFDLLDCELWFTVTKRYGAPDTDAIVKRSWISGGASDGITVDDPATGEAVVTLSPVETATLEKASYRYDLQLKDQSGDIHTIDRGVLVAQWSPTTRTTIP